MTKAFEVIQTHYRQRETAAKAWKNDGGKVVGYFCDAVPEEFILATGFFPFRLSGDPEGETDVARKNVIPRFAARVGFVHSMLNTLLTGGYDFLDYLIIPHSRDSIHRLYQLLEMIKIDRPEYELPELYFLDTVHTSFFSSGNYERKQMMALKAVLEQWAGKAMSMEALNAAIETTNENKRLLKEMAALRADDPPAISGVDALQIIGSAMVMLKSEHNRLLKQFLAKEVDQLSVKRGKRIFVSGSPQDHTGVYECIESNGRVVVGEDHCWGNRYADVPFDTAMDPLEAVIERYRLKTPCSRMFPMDRRIDYCVQEAQKAGADQVLFFVTKHDSAEAWEVPEKIKALEKEGIPSVVLKGQDYSPSDPDKLAAMIDGQEVDE